MKYIVKEKFLDNHSLDELSCWIKENKNNTIFVDARMGGNRLTTRYSFEFKFPKKAYEIQSKIIKTLELSNLSLVPFNDGMVADFAEKGDICYGHTDRVWKEDTITLHCNIKLTDCEGGKPFIENEILNFNKGDMLIYPVSEVYHGSELVKGTKPRMIWTFGFCITKKDYEVIFR